MMQGMLDEHSDNEFIDLAYSISAPADSDLEAECIE